MRPTLAPLLSIFEKDVVAERWRQLKQWGHQTLPDGTGAKGTEMRANLARSRCQKAAEDGTCTWEHVLSEEVFEAFAEAEYEPLRKELVEVATVALAWVEDLDNRNPALVKRGHIDELLDSVRLAEPNVLTDEEMEVPA